MDCETSQDLLPWRLNGSLGEEQVGEIDDHLKTCEACREALEESAFLGRTILDHPSAEAMVAYVGGEATVDEDALVARHIAICVTCAEELEMVRASRREMPDLPFQPTPEAALSPPPPSGPDPSWRRPALLVACLGLLAVGFGWHQARLELDRAKVQIATERSQIADLREDLDSASRRSLEAILRLADRGRNLPLPKRPTVGLPGPVRGGEPEAISIEIGPDIEHVVLEIDCFSGVPFVLVESLEGEFLDATYGRQISELPRCLVPLEAAPLRKAGPVRLTALPEDKFLEGRASEEDESRESYVLTFEIAGSDQDP